MATTPNVCEVELTDGRRVCLSYGVIVAAFIPRGYCPVDADCASRDADVRERCECAGQPRGYLRTDARYSVTSSKHMNAFAGRDSATVPDATLKALCHPVLSK